MLISWPAFTTADGKAVAAGSLSVRLGSGGAFTASLAPNTGAQPAGVYYKVIYQLAGQEPSTEYWVVPATGSVGIGSVRAKLMPPTIAAQVLTRDVADTNYVHVTGDQTVNGTKSFSGLTAQTTNKVINAALYSGADIGAQINAAISANSCGGTNACVIQVPPLGVYSYATGIVLPANTVLDCSGQAGWDAEEFGSGSNATLSYVGTGSALKLSGIQSVAKNCALALGSSATNGVLINSASSGVDHLYISGGGPSTTSITISGSGSGSNIERPFVTNTDIWNFTGTGIYCTQANDLIVAHTTTYGRYGQGTSQSLVLDSQCNGPRLDDVGGGNSGLHGLVVKDSLGTGAPKWIAGDNVTSDCSQGGDGWLFDSTLGSQELAAKFTNSWASGAGQRCDGTIMTTGANGIHISGGTSISFVNQTSRSNVGHGWLIDNSNAAYIKIIAGFTYGNNFGADHGDYNGIEVTNIGAGGLTISGVDLSNSPEGTGHQHYGLEITKANPLNTVFFGNTFGDNTVAPWSIVAGQLYPQYFGNNVPNTGATPTQKMLGDLAIYSNASGFITPHIIPNYGSASNYLFGFGINSYFDGTNWHFPTDGASNGGAALLGSNTGSGGLYVVPSNTPASDRVVSNASLSGYQAFSWDSSGNLTFNHNVTVNGTCTNCGSGSANWAVPGAIGSTTPNSGTFTTLAASGGIAGNLTGNVTGNLTGNVTGSVNGAIGSTTPSTGVFTTSQSKYDPLLNVKVWGAVGDGSTDDTAAIQAAATYACGKEGNVYLPPTGSNYKITSHILLTGDGCSFGGNAGGYGSQRTGILWAAPTITLTGGAVSTTGGTTTLTGTASSVLVVGQEITVFFLGLSAGLDGYRIGSGFQGAPASYTVTVGGTSFTATRPSSSSPYTGSYSATTTGYIANDDPIVISGAWIKVHDLQIYPASASNYWRSGLHYAGAPGTEWVSRSTLGTISNVQVNCSGNYGIGYLSGDLNGNGSDQADQGDFTNIQATHCLSGFRYIGGNTLNLKITKMASAHNHMGASADISSSATFFAPEMDENDIDWVPSIGGQMNVIGGDGEGPRIISANTAGGSSANSQFTWSYFDSRSRGVHPTGCTATTTSGSNIVTFNKACAIENEWIVIPGALFYDGATNVQVQVLRWVTPDGLNVLISGYTAHASVTGVPIYWYIQDCMSAAAPQNYLSMAGNGVAMSAGHPDIGFASHCTVEGENDNQHLNVQGAGAGGADLAVSIPAANWYTPTGGNCGTLTGPFVACATNAYGNAASSVSNAHIYDAVHSYGFYGTNTHNSTGASGPYVAIGNQIGHVGFPVSYDSGARSLWEGNTFSDPALPSPSGYALTGNLKAISNTAGVTSGVQMADYLGQNTVLQGPTSGAITLATQAAAGTYNWNWPITAGSAGQFLTSQGGSNNAMTWTDLGSPPAIGGSTPNSGAFTTLTGQVVNGIPNAARFSGADACAKINGAIASLDATVGGTVEARGFVTSDLATACTTTLTIDRPVRLLLPEGVLLLGGNPGILINTYSSGVKIEGRGWEANYNPSAGKGTILRSTGAYPMIVDTAGSQGTQLLEVELDGHNTGTFGFLGVFAGGMTFRHVHVHNFQYTGLMALGGINSYYDVWSNNNGGEGMVIASDVTVEGNMQVALNGGSGVHMISAGAHFKGTDSDHNGLHGIYIDGRHRADWTAGTKIIQPVVIMPLTNNAGGYLYYSANVGGTTGTTAPAWNQTPNAVFSDGSVTWVNIGNNVAARTMDAIAQSAWIEGGYVDDNGTATASYPGFVADNIRVEGDPVVNFQNSCNWINITGTWVSQASVRNATITGIHFLNCYESEISGAVLLGSGYAGDLAQLTPDQGGLVVENSGMNTFSNITTHFQTRSAVQLINAKENVFSNLSLTYGAANSSVPSPMNYAINIDANSSTNQFNMVNIDTGETRIPRGFTTAAARPISTTIRRCRVSRRRWTICSTQH